ncbi:HAD family hydrolase [Eubacterium oxidoreducens]|uniref:Haloacid dehalogenase superfamily, subfamily IA, variant 3 with third motif having DD or ED/haloacid dehalogenase superfamily, subfamily IA, variant 1 with third motif having Dx(3-4)D or Dx(3-4)E n=1 Tax=Eubacterium oxidoreducens TaxID=1732 RepID=A0A1G6CQI6_EUBOX|nr:HAD family hydrolase [Eubacterium oxidoreducens]SDB35163.1 haloacid dehalogenase superfamily, subfamily IA, variant 3 with third motif having DD or ED/haloacid dehalogenase superfamily, subfamily IA, variant 1 with third motif having Dx(3-4)D or Dx(3-4)E [Eubacterium oxidoreducens]
MNYKAILFDLDGTLLPMDMDEFCYGYFGDLFQKLEPYGMTKDIMMKAMGTGIRAMAANEGCNTNDVAFWNNFEFITGMKRADIEAVCEEFYANDFHKSKRFTQDNPLAKKAVQLAHKKAAKVVLATNPYFPYAGQKTRISWVGLDADDFDLITHYTSEHFCKPNPKYYLAICKKIGVEPRECLMIGNDEREDMHPASMIGMHCYLVKDCVIKDAEHPWQGPGGSFEDMIEMLEQL